MRLHLTEELYEAGGITTALGENELKALRISVDIMRGTFVGPTDIDHIIPHNEADFIAYDPFRYIDKNGPNEQSEYVETWTRGQIGGFAVATYMTAREAHIMSYSPDPEIPNPVLGTVLAIMEAPSKEDADKIIEAFGERQRYNPLEDVNAPNNALRRILLGFEAANIALSESRNYTGASEIVNSYNELALVA